MVLQQRKEKNWFKNNYNFITRFANRKRNRIYMRSKKKEKKIQAFFALTNFGNNGIYKVNFVYF